MWSRCLKRLAGGQIHQQVKQFSVIGGQAELHFVKEDEPDHHDIHCGEHGAPENPAPQRDLRGKIEIQDVVDVSDQDQATQDELVAEQESAEIQECSNMHDVSAVEQLLKNCR